MPETPTPEADRVEPLLLDVPTAVRRSGLNRSRIYEAIGSGALHSIRIGRRRMIPERSLVDWIESLIADAA
ncbi:MAG: helix-turn-helix domain-containing protein [Actinobacteria bacterium]|nr:helix-turn-helix domain-containing protein [Actinomycetota bacterium]